MNGLPYYKAYPRDFIEGTIGMPFEVKCAYRVVLDLIYMQGGDLPDDPRYISGLLGCSIRKWKSIRETLIQMGKVEVSGEFLTNKRARNELETLAKLQDKQRENAVAPRKNNNLQKPPLSHTEPEPEPYRKEPTNVGSQNELFPKPEKPKRKTQFPEDWTPDEKLKIWAREKGHDDRSISEMAERCVNHHRGKGNLFLDHSAAFRTWVLGQARFAASSTTGAPPPNRNGPVSYESQADAIMRRRRASQSQN